jgi:hypothetical protein
LNYGLREERGLNPKKNWVRRRLDWIWWSPVRW